MPTARDGLLAPVRGWILNAALWAETNGRFPSFADIRPKRQVRKVRGKCHLGRSRTAGSEGLTLLTKHRGGGIGIVHPGRGKPGGSLAAGLERGSACAAGSVLVGGAADCCDCARATAGRLKAARRTRRRCMGSPLVRVDCQHSTPMEAPPLLKRLFPPPAPRLPTSRPLVFILSQVFPKSRPSTHSGPSADPGHATAISWEGKGWANAQASWASPSSQLS